MSNLSLPYQFELQRICDDVSNQRLSKIDLGQYLKDYLYNDIIPYDPDSSDIRTSTLFGTIHVLADWLSENGSIHSEELRRYLSNRTGIDRVRAIIDANNTSPNNLYRDFLDYMHEGRNNENV
jgi:hypothetical protein